MGITKKKTCSFADWLYEQLQERNDYNSIISIKCGLLLTGEVFALYYREKYNAIAFGSNRWSTVLAAFRRDERLFPEGMPSMIPYYNAKTKHLARGIVLESPAHKLGISEDYIPQPDHGYIPIDDESYSLMRKEMKTAKRRKQAGADT